MRGYGDGYFSAGLGELLWVGFLPVLPQVLGVTQCVKPGIPFAALDRVGFYTFFFLLSFPWAQLLFCSWLGCRAQGWMLTPTPLCPSLGKDKEGFVPPLTFTMANTAQQNGEFCSSYFLAGAELVWVPDADFLRAKINKLRVKINLYWFFFSVKCRWKDTYEV